MGFGVDGKVETASPSSASDIRKRATGSAAGVPVPLKSSSIRVTIAVATHLLLQRLHTLSAVFVCDPSANRVGSTCAHVLSGSAASFPLLATAARAGVVDAIRNQVQEQREVGYVFAGSQPSLMKEMLSAKRPFHKAGPQMFLDKIPANDWKDFSTRHFRKRSRTLDEQGLETLLASADLIPYDVQRIAHELWDYAELKDKRPTRCVRCEVRH
jgi:hypothetical protein